MDFSWPKFLHSSIQFHSEKLSLSLPPFLSKHYRQIYIRGRHLPFVCVRSGFGAGWSLCKIQREDDMKCIKQQQTQQQPIPDCVFRLHITPASLNSRHPHNPSSVWRSGIENDSPHYHNLTISGRIKLFFTQRQYLSLFCEKALRMWCKTSFQRSLEFSTQLSLSFVRSIVCHKECTSSHNPTVLCVSSVSYPTHIKLNLPIVSSEALPFKPRGSAELSHDDVVCSEFNVHKHRFVGGRRRWREGGKKVN